MEEGTTTLEETDVGVSIAEDAVVVEDKEETTSKVVVEAVDLDSNMQVASAMINEMSMTKLNGPNKAIKIPVGQHWINLIHTTEVITTKITILEVLLMAIIIRLLGKYKTLQILLLKQSFSAE